MPIGQEELDALLAEIERLRLENALLRQAAGINITPKQDLERLQVSNGERNALLKRTT